MCEHLWDLEEEIKWEETFIEKQGKYLDIKHQELLERRLRLEELYARRTWLGKFLYFCKHHVFNDNSY